MKDPYLYVGTETLINLFDEKNEQRLDEIEANYTGLRLRQLMDNPVQGNFDFEHLCNIHKFIFQDLFSWAGKPRIINIEKPEAALGGLSIEYADFQRIQKETEIACNKLQKADWKYLTVMEKAELFAIYMSELWKVHPFREGNTRTIITFCCDFADKHGFPLNRKLFKDNSIFVRRALVACSAVFHDLGDKSQPQHLIRIMSDSINTKPP
jgi:cell filamentation protein